MKNAKIFQAFDPFTLNRNGHKIAFTETKNAKNFPPFGPFTLNKNGHKIVFNEIKNVQIFPAFSLTTEMAINLL